VPVVPLVQVVVELAVEVYGTDAAVIMAAKGMLSIFFSTFSLLSAISSLISSRISFLSASVSLASW
jgi:hypothetical protein